MKKSTLQRLKERYFCQISGHLGHHGDCNIWDYELKHCSCGFIHDLDVIDCPDKLYEKYFEDYRKSYSLKPMTEEKKKEMLELLDKIFDKNKEVIDETQIPKEWDLIEEVFGSNFRKRRELEWAKQSEKI